ncbi:MAG: hypothetical protein J0H55_06255 [Chitinophagaceae bacterium]|nr:hypothetical protein [Chitinophagaceae bacterium]
MKRKYQKEYNLLSFCGKWYYHPSLQPGPFKIITILIQSNSVLFLHQKGYQKNTRKDVLIAASTLTTFALSGFIRYLYSSFFKT